MFLFPRHDLPEFYRSPLPSLGAEGARKAGRQGRIFRNFCQSQQQRWAGYPTRGVTRL
jgi:hypothetical protein